MILNIDLIPMVTICQIHIYYKRSTKVN